MSSDEYYCTGCGCTVSLTDEVCPDCGKDITDTAEEEGEAFQASEETLITEK